MFVLPDSCILHQPSSAFPQRIFQRRSVFFSFTAFSASAVTLLFCTVPYLAVWVPATLNAARAVAEYFNQTIHDLIELVVVPEARLPFSELFHDLIETICRDDAAQIIDGVLYFSLTNPTSITVKAAITNIACQVFICHLIFHPPYTLFYAVLVV